MPDENSSEAELVNLSDQIVAQFELWFETEFIPHQLVLLENWKKGSKHKINPFLVTLKSMAMTGSATPEGIAESLITISWLGQGMNTSFGTQFQSKLVDILQNVLGSTTSGIDVEYIDALDDRKKYLQLKLGPETINKDDVETIRNHFKSVKNLARTNKVSLQHDDLVIGVLYGSKEQLNAFYLTLENEFTLLLGDELWHHMTGEKGIHERLIKSAIKIANKAKLIDQYKDAINSLAAQPEIQAIVGDAR